MTSTDHVYEVAGTSGPIEISVDTWGVPHINAHSSEDAFFGQGFAVAQTRLFQLDWWRRIGLGLVAEALGEKYVERDRAARLFLYRGDMQSEWRAYGDKIQQAVSAFTSGINAWITLTRQDPALLGPEFHELGYLPGLWDPSDVVRIRAHGIYGNLEDEVARAITLREFGAEVEDLRRERVPWHPIQVPDGLDLDVITEDVLTVYRLATGPMTAAPIGPRVTPDGSNNWVVSGGRTATGRPLLANDPHRAMTMPSLRHIVHLTCPDFDVIGAGEPALPGVSIGHNGHVAFGLTTWKTDQEDLYVYELHPDNPHLYRYRDTWTLMTVVNEEIARRGTSPTQSELLFTVHGPVIYTDPDRSVAFAVRAAWLEPGAAPYLRSIEYATATSVSEMQEVLDRWYTPGSNLVYADTGGSIAWSPRALIPVRPNWDGLLPVPGDGRYERDGFRTADELPHVIDPAAGWIATANEYNLPDDGSWPTIPISYEWFASIRAERIAEVLSADSAVTVASAASLQNDYLNVHARETCGLLSDEYFAETDAEWARRLLLAWDNRMTTDSVAAAVFERWVRGPLRRRLYTAALAVLVSGTQRDRALSQVVPAETMVGDLSVDRRLLRGLAAHPTVRRQVLEESLTAAVAECRSELGDDANSWTWGRINRSQLGHTAAGFLEPDLPWRSTRSLPKSGSSETVGLAAPSPATGIEQTGASFRIVIDVGDWNRSIAINTPGQAGDPRSKHYSDLYDRWHADDYFPLLYTPEAIDRNVSESIKVVPIALSVSARG